MTFQQFYSTTLKNKNKVGEILLLCYARACYKATVIKT